MFSGLAFCTTMRVRKRRTRSLKQHATWLGSVLFNLFIYNLNEDMEGISGKSAHEKMGRASRFHKVSTGWNNQAELAR